MQYAIETIGLTKIFPDWWGRARVTAVNDLNLRVKPNEIYGFLGPNGSGKTTTIKLILNLLHPTKGQALIRGGRCSDPKISAQVGYLPEESYLYRYLTARETLNFYGKIFGLSGAIRKSRIDTLLEMVGLAGMGNRTVGTFSKGMMRRIGLAQALINDPDLLILDEPTSGLDPMGTRQIKDLLKELAQRGKTILLCSHLLADVEDICDRIGILYGGKMQVEGPVENLLEHRDEIQITAGSVSRQTLEQVQNLIKQETELCRITSPMDKLENFFVKTVLTAQQQRQPTQGAAIGTGISGFLADKPVQPKPDVLDQLVHKTMSPVQHAQGNAETETAKAKPSEPLQDSELLRHLTKPQPTPAPQPESNEKAETPPPPAPEVRRDMLDQLAGQNQSGQTERTEKPDSQEQSDA